MQLKALTVMNGYNILTQDQEKYLNLQDVIFTTGFCEKKRD